MDNSDIVEQYISSLSPNEKKAYDIAKSHLESSFDIEKSIGYKSFKENLSSQTASATTTTTSSVLNS